jgi:two-component system sensor histidine kinase/response regulator
VQLEQSAGASRTSRGLGLAFCRLAVEAHGGKIWVEDANPGARFSLILPNSE